MSELQLLLQPMIERWRSENIPITPGVETARIIEFEFRHNVKFPADMREFYSTVNGMGGDYDRSHFFRFWPLEEIEPVKAYYPKLAIALPESAEYFCFFDHSIDLFIYAILLQVDETTETPIAKIYPQIDDPHFDIFCNSFADFTAKYVANPNCLF